MHSIKHWFTINVLPTMATENPQAFSREAFIFFCGGSIMTCITSFQQKQNVKDIFIDGHRRKEQQKDSDISKSIKKVKLWGHHRKWTWRSWLWHCKNWDPATARWYKSCYVLQKIKNRWVKKAKKPRKSLGFNWNCHRSTIPVNGYTIIPYTGKEGGESRGNELP